MHTFKINNVFHLFFKKKKTTQTKKILIQDFTVSILDKSAFGYLSNEHLSPFQPIILLLRQCLQPQRVL